MDCWVFGALYKQCIRGTHFENYLRDQWIRNILNKIEAEQGKLMKVPSDCFKYEACQTSKMARFGKIVKES